MVGCIYCQGQYPWTWTFFFLFSYLQMKFIRFCVCVCGRYNNIHIKNGNENYYGLYMKKKMKTETTEKKTSTPLKKKPNLHLEEPEYTTEYQNQIFFRFFFFTFGWILNKCKKKKIFLYFCTLYIQKKCIYIVLLWYMMSSGYIISRQTYTTSKTTTTT